MAETAGVQTFDVDGTTVLSEIGGHVLTQRVNLAAKVGEVASMWAHLEAQLGGYMAVLLETTPERAFALLEQYRSANATAEAAKSLAKVTLLGTEREAFLASLSRFKELATQRNQVQHAVWAWNSGDPDALYRMTAVEFSVFTLQMVSADDPKEFVDTFLEGLSDRYDEARLHNLVEDIHKLLLSLTKQAIHRLRIILGHPI